MRERIVSGKFYYIILIPYLKIYLLIYLAALCLSCGMQGLCSLMQDLFIAVHRLQLWHTGLVLVACGLNCYATCGILVSPTRDQTHVPCIAKWTCNHWTTREATVLTIYRFSLTVAGSKSWKNYWVTDWQSTDCMLNFPWIQPWYAYRGKLSWAFNWNALSLYIKYIEGLDMDTDLWDFPYRGFLYRSAFVEKKKRSAFVIAFMHIPRA